MNPNHSFLPGLWLSSHEQIFLTVQQLVLHKVFYGSTKTFTAFVQFAMIRKVTAKTVAMGQTDYCTKVVFLVKYCIIKI